MTKQEIINLQQQLINQGYLDNTRNINGEFKEADGIYGSRTAQAYARFVQDQNKSRASEMSMQQIKAYEDLINQGDNENIINTYYRQTGDPTPYIVDDKVNNKVKIYQNGKLIREYKAIHGKYSNSFGNTFQKRIPTKNSSYTVQAGENLSTIAKKLGTTTAELQRLNKIQNPNLIHIGDVLKHPGYTLQETEVNPDEMTITYTDKNGHIINLAGNLTTPAGIYYSTPSNYKGSPSFFRRTQDQIKKNSPRGIPSAIHVRTIKENANTNGCTGLSKEDVTDMQRVLKGYDKIPTYILPADSRNKFKIRNAHMSFSSHDLSKTPSHHEMDYSPISKIIFSTKDLDDNKRLIIKAFSRGLIANKKVLQKDLGINNDTYNQLATYSLGILGAETNYGDRHGVISNLLHAVGKALSKSHSSPDYYSKYYTYGANADNNSVGLTQIRMSELGNEAKQLFNKYGITKESLVRDPQKAAIATLIKLALEYKGQGMNYDRAIKSWNRRPSYVDRVKKNSTRFNVYQKYVTAPLDAKGKQGLANMYQQIKQKMRIRKAEEGTKLNTWNKIGNWFNNNKDTISGVLGQAMSAISSIKQQHEQNKMVEAYKKSLEAGMKADKEAARIATYKEALEKGTDRSPVVNAFNANNIANTTDYSSIDKQYQQKINNLDWMQAQNQADSTGDFINAIGGIAGTFLNKNNKSISNSASVLNNAVYKNPVKYDFTSQISKTNPIQTAANQIPAKQGSLTWYKQQYGL